MWKYTRLFVTFALVTFVAAGFGPAGAHQRDAAVVRTCQAPTPAPWPPGYLNFETPHCNPIALGGRGRLYVVDTPGGSIVELTRWGRVVRRLHVGLEPAGVAVRPDGQVLYVTNHLSDSISVVDLDSWSVIAVVQQIGSANRLSLLDEPCGVRFSPAGDRAYVTLSQPNRLAVIDAVNHTVERIVEIEGEDPRALAVSADGRHVFVAAFESGNRTEVEVPGEDRVYRNGPFWWYPFLELIENALGKTGTTGEIRRPRSGSNEPARPDRDVFVVDTQTWQVTPITGVGTLLYGVAASADGSSLYAVGTDHLNFRDGPAELDGRPVHNELVTLTADSGGWSSVEQQRTALDEDDRGRPMAGGAVPYAVTETAAGELLVTAASSDRLLVLDADRNVRARIPVGSLPRGVVTRGNRAWTYNRGDSTVSLVRLDRGREMRRFSFAQDPAPARLEEGRKLFYAARFSENGTFSCGSCHPDAHTDQLVWNLGEGNRVTQTVRGIAGTEGFHWDGSQVDARTLVQGGVEGPVFRGSIEPCETDLMAHFLLNVAFPPSPHRAPDDALSADARTGAAVVRRGLWLDEDDQLVQPPQFDPALEGVIRNVLGPSAVPSLGEGCAAAGCHSAPLWTSGGTGPPPFIQAVTLRGMWDRHTWLHDGTPSKIATLEATNAYQSFFGHAPPYTGTPSADAASAGFFTAFFRQHEGLMTPDPVAMHPHIRAFLRELGTGTPGALGRQMVYDGSPDPEEAAVLTEIIQAATAGKVRMRVDGPIGGREYHWTWQPGRGFVTGEGQVWSQRRLQEELQGAAYQLLVTADLPEHTETRPLLRTVVVQGQSEIATAVNGKTQTFELRGDGFESGMWLLMDGKPWVQPKVLDRRTAVHTESPVSATGPFHILSVMNPKGLQSNEFPLPVVGTPSGAGRSFQP